MIIIKEHKNDLSETVSSFVVDYWGEKVTYNVTTGRTGIPYYAAKDTSKAALALSRKAEQLFLDAQKKAGLKEAFPGSFTSSKFLPDGGFAY